MGGRACLPVPSANLLLLPLQGLKGVRISLEQLPQVVSAVLQVGGRAGLAQRRCSLGVLGQQFVLPCPPFWTHLARWLTHPMYPQSAVQPAHLC